MIYFNNHNLLTLVLIDILISVGGEFMIRSVGIIGNPLGHSISPVFQQAAFDYLKLNVEYKIWETSSSDFQEVVQNLRKVECLGANITIPYKEEVIEYLDDLDPKAKLIGAVNTIVKNNNKLIGYNTDAFGFIQSIKANSNFSFKAKKALILGAGGAARAAAFSMIDEGINSLVIANRSLERANKLGEDISGFIEVETLDLKSSYFEKFVGSSNLIVNASSVGMAHTDLNNQSLIKVDWISQGSLVFDMVYNPITTSLIADSRKAGLETINGLSMLIYQGAASFNLWTNRDAPIQIMIDAAEEAMK